MKQLIGSNLEQSFIDFNIKAEKKFQAQPDIFDISLQVWELSDEEFHKYSLISNLDWDNDKHGWWVYGGCNHPKNQTTQAKIKGNQLTVFIEDEEFFMNEYVDLSDYLESHIGISKYNNIAFYIHSLAELNKMSKAEFMSKFW